MRELPTLLQGFSVNKLISKHNASAHTIASYRDTFIFLLPFASEQSTREAHQLTLEDLGSETIATFLTHLEVGCGNSVANRNIRLAAIRSFFRYPSYRCQEQVATIAKVLSIPVKRTARAVVAYLSADEAKALINATDTTRGLADDTMRCRIWIHTGLRVFELTAVTITDIHLGTGAHVHCRGKGRKGRNTPLSTPTVEILKKWVLELEKEPSGPLFQLGGNPARPGRSCEAAQETYRGSDHGMPESGHQKRHDLYAAPHHGNAAPPSRSGPECRRDLARPPID
nr:tyrosine-type recombinase/integrase [Arthrobacter sp. MYb227]